MKLNDNLQKLPKMREGGIFIMEEAIRFGYRKASLRLINEVMMYLKIVTLVEITTANRKEIISNAINVQPTQDLPKFKWPRRQSYLTKEHKDTWRKFLKDAFIDKSPNMKLQKQLRDTVDNTTKHWTWCLLGIEVRLYRKSQNRWEIYTKSPQ